MTRRKQPSKADYPWNTRTELFIHDPTGRLKQRLPLFSALTPLWALPSRWRAKIAPHLREFDPWRWADCWMWDGPVSSRGEPIIYDTKVENGANIPYSIMAKRWLMETLFLDSSNSPRRTTDDAPDYDVIHLCGNVACMNPQHMQIRTDHGNQRSPQDLAKMRLKLLDPGEYYQP